MIGAGGEQLGVISKEEALRKAQAAGMDLVEIAPNVQPPVAKIVDFEKFRYNESKKEQEAKKNVKEILLKEIWISPRIDDHDLETRLRKAEQFFKEGNRVKLTVKFRGREMIHPENGHKVLNKALGILGEKVGVEREVKFEGRNLTVILKPI